MTSIAAPPAPSVADLYRVHAAAVYAHCHRILRDHAAAQDLSQETFVRVLRHAHSVPPSPGVRQWMCRIAINLCLNAIRDARLRPEGDQPIEALPSYACAEGAIIARDTIRQVINLAPQSLRGVAWLYHVEGLQQEALAKLLGISRRTVVNRLAAFAEHRRCFQGTQLAA